MDGVAYLNIGMRHSDNLVVSLLSLTEHWDGPVCIWVGEPEGKKVAEECRDDGRLGRIQIIEFDYAQMRADQNSRRGSHYFAKTFCMANLSPFDRTVFLDADTQVAGDFTDMFPGEEEMRITQFGEWVSRGGMMRGRIEKWRGVAAKEVICMMSADYPAINTGVIGFSKTSTRFLNAWEEMTSRQIQFIADEIAMQLIYPNYPRTVMDCRWNASPRHCWKLHGFPGTCGGKRMDCAADHGLTPDARIWHHHGHKAIQEPRGRYLWWPFYERAVKDNIANINQWSSGGHNKRLSRYLKDNSKGGPDFIPEQVMSGLDMADMNKIA